MILAAEDSFFYIPTIGEFFPPAIFGDGTIFEFNRIQLVRLILVVLMIVFFGLVAHRAKLVPGRVQGAVEMVTDFLLDNVIYGVLGERDGRRFAPMLLTMFFALFVLNIGGVIPGMNIAGTSVIGLVLMFALWTFVVYMVAGFRKHGAGFLKTATILPNVPLPIHFLLVPIEFLQLTVIRWASLTIRLLANMMAGHFLLVLFMSMTHALITSLQPGLMAVGAVSFAGAFAVTIFEIFIAALQAFIFTILSAVYIQMAIAEDH